MKLRSGTELLDAPMFLIAWFAVMTAGVYLVKASVDSTGLLFSLIGVLTASLLFLIFFLISENDYLGDMLNVFSRNKYFESLKFMGGFLFFVILDLFGAYIEPISVFLQNIFTTSAAVSTEFWRTLAVTNTAAGELGIVGFMAPTIEEMWRLSCAYIGVIFIFMMYRAFFKGEPNRILSLVGGSLVGALIFALFHLPNSFAWPFVFGFVATMLTIYFKAFSIAWGAHMGFNFVTLGAQTVFLGFFTSWFGFGVFLFLLLQIVFIYLGVVKKELLPR